MRNYDINNLSCLKKTGHYRPTVSTLLQDIRDELESQRKLDGAEIAHYAKKLNIPEEVYLNFIQAGNISFEHYLQIAIALGNASQVLSSVREARRLRKD